MFSSPKTKNTLDKSSVGVVYLSLQISIVLTATQTCYANRPTAENLIFSSTSASVVIRCGTSSSVKSSSTLKSKSQTAGQLRLRRTKAKKRLQPGQWLHSSRYPQIFREGQGENARHLQLFHLEIFAQYQPKIKCSRPCSRCLMQKFLSTIWCRSKEIRKFQEMHSHIMIKSIPFEIIKRIDQKLRIN